MISSFFPSTKERPHIIFVLGKGVSGRRRSPYLRAFPSQTGGRYY